jgi:hypothetical protein
MHQDRDQNANPEEPPLPKNERFRRRCAPYIKTSCPELPKEDKAKKAPRLRPRPDVQVDVQEWLAARCNLLLNYIRHVTLINIDLKVGRGYKRGMASCPDRYGR